MSDSWEDSIRRVARRTWERPQSGFWILKFDPSGKENSRLWVDDWSEAQRVSLEFSKQPGVQRVMLRDRTDMPLMSFVKGRKLATKTTSEKEDEEAERLIRRSPPKKPPRRDLERGRVKDQDIDPDLKADRRDRSHNFKHNGSAMARRVARRHKTATEEEHPAGKAWKSENGSWVAKNPDGQSHGFGKEPGAEEKAKSYAKGEGSGSGPKDPVDTMTEALSKMKPKKVKEILDDLEGAFSRGGDLGALKNEQKVPVGLLEAMGLPKGLFQTVGEIRDAIDDREEVESRLSKKKSDKQQSPPKKNPVLEVPPPDDDPEDPNSDFNNPPKSEKDVPPPDDDPDDPDSDFNNPPEDEEPVKETEDIDPKTSASVKALLSSAGLGSYDFDLEDTTPEFRVALSKAIADAEDKNKNLVKSILSGKVSGEETEKALSEAEEYFDNFSSDFVLPEEMAKHLAATSIKKQMAAALKESDKNMSDTLKSMSRDASSTVSSILENMGPVKRFHTQKALMAEIRKNPTPFDLNKGVLDDKHSEEIDNAITESDEFFKDLDSEDELPNLTELAKHLNNSALRSGLEKKTKEADKSLKKDLKALPKELAGTLSSIVENLGPAGKILFASQIQERLKQSSEKANALLQASDADKAKAELEFKKAEEFFSSNHEDRISAETLLDSVSSLMVKDFISHPLNQFKVPGDAEAKTSIEGSDSEDSTLKEEADKKLSEVREKATEKAHAAFERYTEETPEVRNSHLESIQKEIDSLPENSPRRIQAEGIRRGIQVAKILQEGDEAVKVAPAFASLVKAAHKNGDIDVLLNVHRNFDNALAADLEMQSDVNRVLDSVDDGDWPDMIGENHPLAKMALALTDLDNHLSPHMRESIREELKNSVRTGLMIIDPVLMQESLESNVGALRNKSGEMYSDFSSVDLSAVIDDSINNPSKDSWAKLKAILERIRQSASKWSKKNRNPSANRVASRYVSPTIFVE